MTDFDLAFTFITKWEGGSRITNDPDDPGGLTKYGLSKRANPDLDIENLTEDQAKEVYQIRYWIAGKCDKLRFPVNVAHFDACVNCGVIQSAKFLQRAVDVEDDGIVGPHTLSAIVTQNQEAICRKMIKERVEYYRYIAEHKPSSAKYLQGWMNRIADLKRFIGITQEIA